MRFDGSGARVLVRRAAGTVFAARPSWSPDSRRLAYCESNLFTPQNLFFVDAATGETKQLTQFTKSNQGVNGVAWLPDNRHLVVTYVPVSRQVAVNDLGILDAEN